MVGTTGLETAACAVTVAGFEYFSKTAEVWRFRNSELSIRMAAGFAEDIETTEILVTGVRFELTTFGL